jgi:hypothetical protein
MPGKTRAAVFKNEPDWKSLSAGESLPESFVVILNLDSLLKK